MTLGLYARSVKPISSRRPSPPHEGAASYLTDQFTAAENAWAKAGKVEPCHHDQLGVIGLLLVRINGIFRNPVMHPEMTLDGDTALEVFGLVCRVISAIAVDLDARRERLAI